MTMIKTIQYFRWKGGTEIDMNITKIITALVKFIGRDNKRLFGVLGFAVLIFALWIINKSHISFRFDANEEPSREIGMKGK
jgi:phosphate starvation-inducible membrane PsiE